MRVARQWRLLKTLKWNGYGIGDGSPGQGELALFCPACPQPGINVPVEPGNDFTHWKYTRTIVMDGNFKAEHMHCSSPEDDVYLMDGLAFMVTRPRYKEFLALTEYPAEVGLTMPVRLGLTGDTSLDSVPIATITGQSTGLMPIGIGWRRRESAAAHVLDMGAFTHMRWSTSRRAKGESPNITCWN